MSNANDRRWDELNALVDGELPPARVAEVAAWIADDREAARAFATLAALKGATAGVGEASLGATSLGEAGVGESSLGAAGRRHAAAGWQRGLKIAAVLVVAAGLGGAAVLAVQGAASLGSTLAAFAPRSLGLPDDVIVGGIRLPNLEAGGLRLERAGLVQDGAAPRLEASYVGGRGCRVHLTVARVADADALPAGGQSAQWTVGSFVFTLAGERMDPQRFASVTQIAQAETAGATRLAAGPDLRHRPCLG